MVKAKTKAAKPKPKTKAKPKAKLEVVEVEDSTALKILCISDIHLDYPSDPNDRSLELFRRTSEWFVGLIKEHKPDAVINLGDTNHRDGGMSAGTISLMYEFFNPIFDACLDIDADFFTIIGNHDQYTRNGDLHVMEQLKWGYGEVIDVATIREIKGIPIGLVPYRRDLGEYTESLKQVEGAHMIFTHMDIVGARMNSGIISSHGMDPSNFASVPVFNGHYHYPHDIEGVSVIGSPQYTQYRDIDPIEAPRRGAVLITKGKAKNSNPKLHRIPNPHTDLFIKIKGQTAKQITDSYQEWYGAYNHFYGGKGSIGITGKLNVWFIGPDKELEKVKAKNDWSGFGSVRFTPNDRIEKEDESISIDLAPMHVLAEYHKGAECSCGETHPLDLGKEILEEAGSYMGVERQGAKVEFIGLHIKDFMVLGDVSVDLSQPGLVLVEGINLDDSTVDSNESGKSSISEALLWALFDKTSRGVGKDEVIRYGADKAEVEVDLKINGEQYLIVRSRSKGKPIVEIHSGGDNISPHDQREANNMITELLGVGFDQFLLMVVLAQGFETKFSSLSDTDKKELLESFLGLGIYENARLITKERVDSVKGEMAQIDRREAAIAGSLEATEAHLQDLREEAKKVVAVNNEKRAELSLKIAEYEPQLPQWVNYVSEHQKIVKHWADQTIAAANNRRKLESEMASTRMEWSYATRLSEDAAKKLESVKTSGMSCPECKQAIPQERVEAFIAELEATRKQTAEKMDAINAKVVQLERSIAEAKAFEQQCEAGQAKAIQDLNQAEKGHADIWQKHQNLVLQRDAIPEVDTNYADLIKKSEASATKLRLEHDSVTDDRLAKGETLHKLEFWAEAFDPKGIRSQLLRTIVNKLNDDLAEMSETLTGGAFTVQLSSQTETKTRGAVNKLDLQILPSGESYKAGSGGKRRKIDILLNLAIARLAQETSGFSSNLLVADEVLDNLDLTASQHALQLFNGFSTKQNRLVLLISHNPAIKSLVPDVWTVTRENGVSSVRSE